MSAEIIAEVEDPITPPLRVTDELAPLRRRFVRLMDRATHQVLLAGLEPDDCILERTIRVRPVGDTTEKTIGVESLTDHRYLLKSFIDKHLGGPEGMDSPAPAVEITAIAVRAVRCPDFPPQDAARR